MLPVKEVIAETDRLLADLPEDKVRSVRDYVVFLACQYKETVSEALAATEAEGEFRADVAAIMQHNSAFNFPHDELDLYTDDDLVERYK